MRQAHFERWIFSGVLPVAFAVCIAVTAVIALPQPSVGSIRVGQLAASVVLSGVAAMVLIETAKRLLPLRGAYNRRQVALWMDERVGGKGAPAMGQLIRAMDLMPSESIRSIAQTVREHPKDSESREDNASSLQQPVDLEVGHRWRRVLFPGPGVGGAFNLPAEQLSAQIAAAAERASREGQGYEDLILALCPGLQRKDLRSLKQKDGPISSVSRDVAADVAYRIAAAIDQLQIRLAGRWRHYLQVTAWWLTGLVALAWALADRGSAAHSATFVLAALVFGAFFAWLARDVAAVVERLRR